MEVWRLKVLELSKNFQKGFCITEKGVQGCSQVSRLFRGISEHLKKNQGVLKDSQGVSVPWEVLYIYRLLKEVLVMWIREL